MAKFSVPLQVMEISFKNFKASSSSGKVDNLGDAIKELGLRQKSEDKYKFLVSCLVIGLTIQSITATDFFKLKEAKFNPK